MTLEQKWDLLWPLACAVTHAVERVDTAKPGEIGISEATLAHMARQLKKAVDKISPGGSSNG